jgi:hypothetical protein
MHPMRQPYYPAVVPNDEDDDEDADVVRAVAPKRGPRASAPKARTPPSAPAKKPTLRKPPARHKGGPQTGRIEGEYGKSVTHGGVIACKDKHGKWRPVGT